MPNAEKVATGLPPDLTNQFYDLRALAMNASAMTFIAESEMTGSQGSSDELNAIRRVLSVLSDKALEFANQADGFLMSLPDAQTTGGYPSIKSSSIQFSG